MGKLYQMEAVFVELVARKSGHRQRLHYTIGAEVTFEDVVAWKQVADRFWLERRREIEARAAQLKLQPELDE